MTRGDVYKLIDGERAYHDSLRPDTFTETKLPVSGEILCIESYVTIAKNKYVTGAGEIPVECLEAIRKVAAMCVRVMEHYETPARKV